MNGYPYMRGDRVVHRTMGPATVYQDRNGYTYIYITPDNQEGLAISVAEQELRAEYVSQVTAK